MGANDKTAATFHPSKGPTMGTKRITVKGGPLTGNEYDVPEDTEILDIEVPGGTYTVGPKHANWKADDVKRPVTRPTQVEKHGASPAPTADTPE